MLLAGDEFGRTQRGNNNAYCHDDEIGWVDWNIDERGRDLMAFVSNLNFLRQHLPVLRRNRFLTGDYNPVLAVSDVRWLGADGADLTPEQWQDPERRSFAMVIDGRAQSSGIPRPSSDITLLLLVNADHRDVPFLMPSIPGPQQWTLLLDTVTPTRQELPVVAVGDQHVLPGRALALFALIAPGTTSGHVDLIRRGVLSDVKPDGAWHRV